MTVTTFSPSDQVGVTLSNGNLTATWGSGNPAQIRSTTSKVAGKWHVEFTVGASSGAGNFLLGIMSNGLAIPQFVQLNTTSMSAGNDDLGRNWFNSVQVAGGTSFSYSSGDTIALEIDFDGQIISYQNFTKLSGWINRNLAGLSGRPWCVLAQLQTTGDSVTANFGAKAFGVALQPGFQAWDPTPLFASAMRGMFIIP